MPLDRPFVLVCDVCGVKKELDRVYGRYGVLSDHTPNNAGLGGIYLDGFVPDALYLCDDCFGRVREYVKSLNSKFTSVGNMSSTETEVKKKQKKDDLGNVVEEETEVKKESS
jgi:hypothetical protein